MLTHEAQDRAGKSSSPLKIGELADLAKATTRTLRYYEELGLLKPHRNSAGQRVYNEEAMSRLNLINELKSGGFSLLEIKSFFESWKDNPTGAEAAQATIELVQKKLLDIADLQKKLASLNEELRGMVGFILACRNCDRKPSDENCNPCDDHLVQETPRILQNILKGDLT